MDPEKSTSLYEHFDRPSSILELVDYSPGKPLYKPVLRRLIRIAQARHTDDWRPVDRMVERLIIKRIRAGSMCIIGSFFGIDEYSHLYNPFHEKTIGAYENIDRAVGNVASTLKEKGIYEETLLAVVSDHGLSATKVHIPLVDIVKRHGFNPYYYPKLYRSACDSAVMESGNAMAQLYFKRGDRWGEHWRHEEMRRQPRINRLISTMMNLEGISFLCTRTNNDSIVFIGKSGSLTATRSNDSYQVAVTGRNPLKEHPEGTFGREELFHLTYDHTYPDAVNQLFMLLGSPRSGDITVVSEPSYDLRLQYEDPEHHSSHGSLHREHMRVPLALSVPFKNQHVYNYDLMPTLLALTGKQSDKPLDGRLLEIENGNLYDTGAVGDATDKLAVPTSGEEKKGKLSSVLITVGIMLVGTALAGLFKDDINAFGMGLMNRYGQGWIDVVLFLITMVSCTPLVLPVWGYALAGVALGYNVVRLAAVMAFGSALGSFVTFTLGRYFGNSGWIRQRFPNIHRHPWTHGRSRTFVTLALFVGTSSPIPCDVAYVACGAKRYPALLFLVTMIVARFVRYIYLGYGFSYFSDWL